jgi:hypothetical protein
MAWRRYFLPPEPAALRQLFIKNTILPLEPKTYYKKIV